MIHLNPNLSELVNSWLDDILDSTTTPIDTKLDEKAKAKEIERRESQRENNRKKMMYAPLREEADKNQAIYMMIQKDGSVVISDKEVKKDELKIDKLVDEENGELVLGEKLIEGIQNAYAIAKVLLPNVSKMLINDWCRGIISNSILSKRKTLYSEDLEKEENELYQVK